MWGIGRVIVQFFEAKLPTSWGEAQKRYPKTNLISIFIEKWDQVNRSHRQLDSKAKDKIANQQMAAAMGGEKWFVSSEKLWETLTAERERRVVHGSHGRLMFGFEVLEYRRI